MRRVTTPDGRQAFTKGEADGLVESFNDAKKTRGDIAPNTLPEGPGAGWNTDWTPPKNWNGPVNHGEWTGPRGNSSWVDERPEVIRVVGTDPSTGKANPIVFYKGKAHFSPYAQETFTVKGLVGTSVDSNADMKLILEEIARRKNLPSKAAARRWLANADDGFGGKGLAPHYASDETIELVPSAIHKVQHTDVSRRGDL